MTHGRKCPLTDICCLAARDFAPDPQPRPAVRFNTVPVESQGYNTTLLNAGARVDVVGGPNWTSPLTVRAYLRNPSLKNFSPRFGFAYDLTGRGRTAIRGAARRWAFYGDLHSQLTKIASGTLARILLAPPETRSYSRTSNTDGVCGRHSQKA
jgi:hypothetical protein